MADEKTPDGEQQKVDAEAAKQKTWTDDEVQKIIKERDTAKKKAQAKEEAEQKALEAKMLEEGKAKELLAQREAELEPLKKKAEEYDRFLTNRRGTLLSKLSDDDKEIATELSLEKLEKFVEKQSQKPTPPPAGQYKPGGTTPKPKFKNAEENAKWLIEQGLAL